MRINHNISAINTNRLLAGNNSATSKNLEKLSSGFAVNRAGDNAAGLAISEKMRGQIRGLDQAKDNANDGISLIQTAEGGLNETHAILQRMRELAVQSATDTNTADDRKEIQKEVDQLTKEITRIATDTEFNTKKLLNGDLAATATESDANFDVKVAAGSNLTTAGTYTINYTGTAAVAGSAAVPGSEEVPASTVTTSAAKATEAGAKGKTYEYKGGKWMEGSNEVGDNSALSAALGVTVSGTPQEGAKIEVADTDDKDITVTNTTKVDAVAGTPAVEAKDATFEVTSITDAAGNKVSNSAFKLDLTTAGKAANLSAGGSISVTVDVSKALTFHIGANENQNTKITVQSMKAEDLGVASIDLTSQANANSAITTIDNAINTVSAQRAALGAMQNRLEHTINNLGTSSENLSAAESQIRDVDMAEEMSNYTKNNILVQAATAMLAQANQQPQSVLSLLQ